MGTLSWEATPTFSLLNWGASHKGMNLRLSEQIVSLRLLCIRKYLLYISLFTRICNILMFCEFEIAVYLSLRERICSPKEFAPLKILNLFLKELAPLRVLCNYVFT